MPRLHIQPAAAAAALILVGVTACSTASQAGSPTAATTAAPTTSAAAPSSPAGTSASPTSPPPTSAAPTPSPTAPEPTRAQKLPDSCGLLTAAEVAVVNGSGGEPVRDGGSDTAAFSIDGCHFGSVKDGLVSVQVVRPGAGSNPVTAALGAGGTPVASLPSGRGFPVGTMLGGSGPGYTVTAVSGDILLAVSLLSTLPVTGVQQAALADAAAAALKRL